MVTWGLCTVYGGRIRGPAHQAELTAFLLLLKKITGPAKVHVDDKRIIDGLWRDEVHRPDIG